MDQNEEFRARFEAEMREERAREEKEAQEAERKEQEYQAFRAAELARLEADAASPTPAPLNAVTPKVPEQDYVVWDKPQTTPDPGWTAGGCFAAIFIIGIIAAIIYLFISLVGVDLWHWFADNSADCAPNCNSGPRYFFFWRR